MNSPGWIMRADLCTRSRKYSGNRRIVPPCDIAGVVLVLTLSFVGAGCAYIDPVVLAAKAVTISVDARTQEEVENDVAIETSCHADFLQDDKAEWVSVTPLVFAQHVVLVGAVKSETARRRAETLLRQDRRIRSLANELVVIRGPGDEGDFVEDKTVDVKINAILTSTPGIGSINMRWKTVNGRVVIMGIVQSPLEARVVVAKIKGLDEVRSVKSHLRVVPSKSEAPTPSRRTS